MPRWLLLAGAGGVLLYALSNRTKVAEVTWSSPAGTRSRRQFDNLIVAQNFVLALRQAGATSVVLSPL